MMKEDSANVSSRMINAICGALVPGYRFAHPGYTLGIGRRRFVARMSNAICGALVPRMSLRSSGLHPRRWTAPLRSPHEQRDMRGLGPPDVAALIRATPSALDGAAS